MDSIEINNELLLPCPDGFAVMTEDDLNLVYTSSIPGRSGIRDAERHVMIRTPKVSVYVLANL